MAQVTRMPNGISTSAPEGPYGDHGASDPTKFARYENDFFSYTAADWTVTEVGVATQVIADEDGGVLLVTNAAADDDSSFQQTINESWTVAPGKENWFSARFKLNEVIESEVVIGLQRRDTTPLNTSGVYFQKLDGTAELALLAGSEGPSVTSTTTITLVDDTYVNVAFHYDGISKITFFQNGNSAGSIDIASVSSIGEMTVSFGVKNGEAVSKIMSVDYINVATER